MEVSMPPSVQPGVPVLVFLVLAGGPALGASSAQTARGVPATASGVSLTLLASPGYPMIARSARVAGDVVVEISIRMNGSVEAARAVSGPPLLTDAALQSARSSTFACKDCKEPPPPFTLTYTFKVRGGYPDCCDGWGRAPDVEQSPGHVTIEAASLCSCDPRRVRTHSWRCLWLWRCG
jgi:protein TonB